MQSSVCDNSQWVFHISVEEFRPNFLCRFVLIHPHLRVFQYELAWLGHSKTLMCRFFEPFRGGPEWCCSFGILLKNSIICSFISYAMSLSWSQAAKQPQTISTPTSCFTVGMMFCEIVKNVLVLCQMQWDVKPSKKFTFCLVSPQNIFLKNLGDRQDVFLINVKQSFFGGVGETLLWGHGYLFLNFSLTLNLTEGREACSSLYSLYVSQETDKYVEVNSTLPVFEWGL